MPVSGRFTCFSARARSSLLTDSIGRRLHWPNHNVYTQFITADVSAGH